jgi:tetratricopeptide (TPR) repeat protein
VGFDVASLSNSNLEYFISDYLIASGKFYEALTFNENALSRNNKADNWVDLALSCNYTNQSEKAFTTINTARELFPNSDYVFTTLIQLLIYQRKYDMAIGLFEKNKPDSDLKKIIPMRLALIGIAYYKSGDKSKSKEFLDELLIKSRESPVGSPSFYTAALYTSMEEKEKAFQSLEKAFSDHEVEMYWVNVDPFFKPLHGDPRFENILTKIGFN